MFWHSALDMLFKIATFLHAIHPNRSINVIILELRILTINSIIN